MKRDMSEVGVVGLVLLGDDEEGEAVDELHAVQGVHPHVHQDPV